MAWKALILIIFTSFLLVACSSATPPEAPVDSFAATGAVDNPEPAASSAVAEPTSPGYRYPSRGQFQYQRGPPSRGQAGKAVPRPSHYGPSFNHG